MSSLTNPPPAGDRPAMVSPKPLPVEVFDPTTDPGRHAGRGAVRRALLAMTPVSGEQFLLPGPMGAVGVREGAFWGLQSKNGLTVALRAASFVNALAARRDAVEMLARATDLEFVDVHAAPGGARSVWVVLDGRVVMVSGQVWGPRAKSTVAALRVALSGLPRA
ncbi:hypothetical protein ACFXQA_14535 [Microbacterium sp. P07]|uniref:hypothetical protein n=1 Tax=Microbacterium sp. P07 TaxID=3366952 RepID=UPI0037458CCB